MFFVFHVMHNKVFYWVSSQGSFHPKIKWLVWVSEWDLSECKYIPFRSQIDDEHFSVHYYQTVKVDNRNILVGWGAEKDLNKEYLLVFWVSKRLKRHCGQGPLPNDIMRMCQPRSHRCHWAQRPQLTPRLRIPEISLPLLLKANSSTLHLRSHLAYFSMRLLEGHMIGRAEVERYRGCWERCGKFLKYGKLLVFFFFLMLDKAGKKKKNQTWKM